MSAGAERVEEAADPERSGGGGRAGLLQKLARALIVLVVLLEAGLRFFGYGRTELYRADPRLYWTLAPDQHRVSKVNHVPVVTNSHGTRGPDFAVPKPPNTFRILALGDSRMFGRGLRDEDTYARRLEAELRRRMPAGRRVEVINAGVDAWSYDQVRVFLRDIALAWQPDLVLLDDANPWTQFTEGASPQFVEAMERRVRLKNLLRRSALYEYLVEDRFSWVYGKLRVLFIPAPGNGAGNGSLAEMRSHITAQVRGIAELLREHRIPAVLLYTPTEVEVKGGPAYGDGRIDREVKQATAREFGLPFLDLTGPLRRAGPSGLFLEGDDHHVNSRGSAVVANAIADLLIGRLEITR